MWDIIFNGVSGCGLVDFEKGVIKLLKKRKGYPKKGNQSNLKRWWMIDF